ncbi:MAG: hypothetical protein QXG65_05505 [Thermoplasmata archaeon]
MRASDRRTAAGERLPRRPGGYGRIVLAAAVAVIVTVAGLGIYEALRPGPGEPTLTIYTYGSLFGGACGSGGSASGIFGNFSAQYHVAIRVECPSGTLVSTLEAQRSDPVADLVIGLDEITAPEAQALGLVIPYSPPGLADVNASLEEELTSDHSVTPYEYGYLGIDYTPSFARATGGAIATGSLPEFATNASWGSQLVYEDPASDITGEEFLAWTATLYGFVLHQDWTGFWQAILPHAQEAPSWGVAFNQMFGNPYGAVVSYTTDPASAAYYGTPGAFQTTVSYVGGVPYGWRTIYGVGIVRGSTHLTLDEAFVNYLLSGSVQAQIPYSEWEYPANQTVAWPPLFQESGLIDPSSIVPLNQFVSPAELAQNFTGPDGWLATWEGLAGA